MRLEVRIPYHDKRAMTHSPSPRSWRPDFPGATREALELPVVPREKHHTCAAARENPRDAPVIARRGPSFSAGPGEQYRVLSPKSTGSLAPCRTLSGLQEISVATREESGVLCFPSRRGLTPRVSLECNPEIPAAPGEEHYVLDRSLDEVSFSLQ